MSVWRLIAADMHAWKRIGWLGPTRATTRLKPREVSTLLWRFPGLRATTLYRFANAAYRRHIPLLSGILYRRALRRYGLDLPSAVPIGPGLYIPHPVGTVIMARQIGANCSVIASVTVGMRHRPVFPIIGDNVTIGTGARVLGDIRIGDAVQIGANAVVLDDVLPGMTVVGIPARPVNGSTIPVSMMGADFRN